MKKNRTFLTIYILFISTFYLHPQNRGGELEIIASDGVVVGIFSQAYALVIGESEYTNGWRRLPGVKDDLAAITKLFQEQGFIVETIENANNSNLRNGITNFLDRYGYIQDARIIVYFAGHGATLDLNGRKMGYIIPVDAPPARNNRDFLQAVIPMTQFETWAKQYTSRHILFVFDSCFAGSVFRSQPSAPPAINRLINQPVRQFLTSGDADEEVPDESIFRRELEHALRNGAADMNNDGYVSGTELGLYLFNKVSNYRDGKQNPRIGKLNDANLDKGDFIFVSGQQPEKTINANTAKEYFERGKLFYDREDWGIAMLELNEALWLEPNYSEAYAYRASVFNKKENYDQGLIDAERAMRLNPQLAFAYYSRGEAYYGKNNFDKSIADLDQAIRLDSEDARFFYAKGFVYYVNKNYDKAIADLDQAIRLEPKNAGYYYFRSGIYLLKNNFDKVIEDSTQAISINPNEVKYYQNRGNAYFNLKNYDNAIADYNQVIRLDPNNARYYNARGLAYKNVNNFDKAISDYDTAIRMDSNNDSYFSNRGLAYYQKNNYVKAIADFDQAIRLNPNDAQYYNNRGGAYFNNKNYDKAIADFDQAIQIDPNNAQYYNNRAEAWKTKGDNTKANADYIRAERLGYK
jgi:tetratricopeptide (TPR) repeat protein